MSSDTKCDCCGRPVVPGSALCRECASALPRSKRAEAAGIFSIRDNHRKAVDEIEASKLTEDEASLIVAYRAMTNTGRGLMRAATFLVVTSPNILEAVITGAVAHTMASFGAEMGRKVALGKDGKSKPDKDSNQAVLCHKTPPCSHPSGNVCSCSCHFYGRYGMK